MKNKIMKNKFMTKTSRTLNKVGFTIKKHSPEILVTAGRNAC